MHLPIQIADVDTVARKIGALLATVSEDPIFPTGTECQELEGPPGVRFFLSHPTEGQGDYRRNADPLMLTKQSAQCMCHFSGRYEPFQTNDESAFFFMPPNSKAIHFSVECGPEPQGNKFGGQAEFSLLAGPLHGHLSDLVEFSSLLPCDHLAVVNLPGSGASIPQHFHSQIFPLRLGNKPNSLAQLFENLRIAEEPYLSQQGVDFHLISGPVWGCQLRFSDAYSPRQIGAWLHSVVHRDLRYASQLFFTYNLYLRWASEPRTVAIVFRESRTQSPFQLAEVRDLVLTRDPRAASAFATSPNRQWRWGFLECLGGFPTRDRLLAVPSVFDFPFWQKLHEIVSVPRPYRERIIDQLTGAGLQFSPDTKGNG